MRDDEAMQRAVQLAAGARRRTAPNPWVGCVLLRDGEIVGEGATQPPGQAHAEVEALAQAGDRAQGATAYTTLEPCSHHGRTGPCADALIAAGVSRVVVALTDPDPKVAGHGLDRIRAAGIEVVEGVGADDARRLLAPYLHHRRTGQAFVVCKLATSLDSRTAAVDGSSQWITGAAARADAHEIRADSQAIVVGSGTALADAPSLTVRDIADPPPAAPLRVVLDGRGRVPATGPLFDTSLAPTLVLTTAAAPTNTVDAWRAAGAKVETVAAAPHGGVDLDAALSVLGGLGVLQAMVEGGATLHGALIAQQKAQRLVAYVAPTLLGTDGRNAFELSGPSTITAASRYAFTNLARIGNDIRIDMELAEVAA